MRFSMRVFQVTTVFMMIAVFTHAKTSSAAGVKTVFWNVFDAKIGDNSVELTWVVTEYNNKSFMVEHSSNGIDWEAIGMVMSKNSHESLETYSFTHKNTGKGKHYYRVKHTDIDVRGTGYSPIRIVTMKNEKQPVDISPNPATDQIRIVNTQNEEKLYTKVMIFDLSGRTVIEKKLQSGVNLVAINELIAGIYVVRLENSEGVAHTQKIIIQ